MRLTTLQQQLIEDTVSLVAGRPVEVWIYGSRLDDARRGGDVDLLVRTMPELSLMERARLKLRLEHLLNLPVDVTTAPLQGSASPFAQMVLASAQRLSRSAP